jgi:hypothetical protein
VRLGIGEVIELGGFRFLVLESGGGYVARIRRSDGALFTYQGTKTDGITTSVQPNEGAAHTEAIRMIEKREIAYS